MGSAESIALSTTRLSDVGSVAFIKAPLRTRDVPGFVYTTSGGLGLGYVSILLLMKERRCQTQLFCHAHVDGYVL